MLKSILKKDSSSNLQPSTKKVVFSKKIKYKTIPNRFDINNVPVSETFGIANEHVIKVSKPLKIDNNCKLNIFRLNIFYNCRPYLSSGALVKNYHI